MALCFINIFGRIGSLAGGNYYGALLYSNCEAIFIMNGVLLTSNYSYTYIKVPRINHNSFSFCVLVSIAVCYIVLVKLYRHKQNSVNK